MLPSSEDIPNFIELSVLLPCLNEADTLSKCIRMARAALDANGIIGEIIVADNGSTDGSRDIAAAEGAVVVRVETRGYGSAVRGGVEKARGRYILLGDADGSYDFAEMPKFVERLRQKYDLVQGCRFPRGGGAIVEGAMPFSHRWIGNPLFSLLAQALFRAPVDDVFCGLRAFSRSLYDRIDPGCDGMEFAVEMVIKSAQLGERIAQIPITLYPVGRLSTSTHLRTVSDGVKTLGLMLSSSAATFIHPIPVRPSLP